MVMKMALPKGRAMKASAIKRAGQVIREGKNQARKNNHRGDGVDEEIEEFRGAADDDPGRNLSRIRMFVADLDHAGIAEKDH
jgi:hypothetical protein